MNEKVRLQVLKDDTEHTYGDVGHKAGDSTVPTTDSDLYTLLDTETTEIEGLLGDINTTGNASLKQDRITAPHGDTGVGIIGYQEGESGADGLYRFVKVGDSGQVFVESSQLDDILTELEGDPSAIVGLGDPTIDSYAHIPINLSAGANQVLVSSAANKQIWVYGVGFTLSVAGSVSFQDEDDTAITGIMPFYANSGLGIPASGNFAMPIWKLATNKDLEVDLVTADMDGWLDYAIVSV